MADGPALLAAIRAAPADDAPRLVYADWLDEHGEPERADLIRAQCEVARRSDEPPHGPTVVRANFFDPTGVPVPCRCTLCVARTRQEELLASPRDRDDYAVRGGQRPDWAGEPVRTYAQFWAWERGFVGKVWVRGDRWVEFAGALLAAQPIRDVILVTWPQHALVPVAGAVQAAVWKDALAATPSFGGHGPDGRAALADALHRRWPSVWFEVPAHSS